VDVEVYYFDITLFISQDSGQLEESTTLASECINRDPGGWSLKSKREKKTEMRDPKKRSQGTLHG
jgi:hypothetical protein